MIFEGLAQDRDHYRDLLNYYILKFFCKGIIKIKFKSIIK
jgi:hypothetical protein